MISCEFSLRPRKTQTVPLPLGQIPMRAIVEQEDRSSKKKIRRNETEALVYLQSKAEKKLS